MSLTNEEFTTKIERVSLCFMCKRLIPKYFEVAYIHFEPIVSSEIIRNIPEIRRDKFIGGLALLDKQCIFIMACFRLHGLSVLKHLDKEDLFDLQQVIDHAMTLIRTSLE